MIGSPVFPTLTSNRNRIGYTDVTLGATSSVVDGNDALICRTGIDKNGITVSSNPPATCKDSSFSVLTSRRVALAARQHSEFQSTIPLCFPENCS
ncbi:MAG: hypothetical protein CMJ70_13375 [Planctomycetaceae bacterium]|nr:hypothetical protein [Planctomycetaceae bacterium]